MNVREQVQRIVRLLEEEECLRQRQEEEAGWHRQTLERRRGIEEEDLRRIRWNGKRD